MGKTDGMGFRSQLADTGRPSSPGDCFSDLTVIESGGSVASSYCGKLLADLGACVIKVEPLDGDPMRRLGPFPNPDADFGALFLYCNTNKLGVTLALETATGRGLFRRLVQEADVVITDHEPEELGRLGLAAAAVENWPGLVIACIRPYGLTGPWAARVGTELDVFHASGEGHLLPGGQGHAIFPDRQPLKAGRFLAEYDAGVAAAVAIAAALIRRDAIGSGDFIEISAQEAEMSVGRVTHDAVLNAGKVITRRDRQYDYGGLFRCRDGYVNIRPNEDRHWVALARGMGRPELGVDERFSTRTARLRNRPEVNALIAAWTASRSWREVEEQLSPLGTPVGVYADASAILESNQLRARGAIRTLPVDDTSVPLLAAPYRMSEARSPVDVRAPHLGEHTTDVFAALGLGRVALAELREGGVV